MKKYLGLLIILAIVSVINVQAVRAEDGKNSGQGEVRTGKLTSKLNDSSEATRVQMEQKRQEIKTQIETAREQSKAKLDTLKTDIKNEKDAAKAKIQELRITGREEALKRFDNAVERITTLEDKVNAFITKFEAKGLDVTIAKADVATADTKLTEAKAKIAEINTLLVGSTNQLSQDDKTKLRTLTKDTQDLIKAAHAALIDAVKSLKDQLKAKMEADQKEKENKGTGGDTGGTNPTTTGNNSDNNNQ